MSDVTPLHNRTTEGMSERDLILEIREKIDGFTTRLANGDTKIALLEDRLGRLEKLNYSAVALILLANGTALIALVIKHT